MDLGEAGPRLRATERGDGREEVCGRGRTTTATASTSANAAISAATSGLASASTGPGGWGQPSDIAPHSAPTAVANGLDDPEGDPFSQLDSDDDCQAAGGAGKPG